MNSAYDSSVTWIQQPDAQSLSEVEVLCLGYSAELHATAGLLEDYRRTIADAARRIARSAVYPLCGGPDAIALARAGSRASPESKRRSSGCCRWRSAARTPWTGRTTGDAAHT